MLQIQANGFSILLCDFIVLFGSCVFLHISLNSHCIYQHFSIDFFFGSVDARREETCFHLIKILHIICIIGLVHFIIIISEKNDNKPNRTEKMNFFFINFNQENSCLSH